MITRQKMKSTYINAQWRVVRYKHRSRGGGGGGGEGAFHLSTYFANGRKVLFGWVGGIGSVLLVGMF